jgi:hypothetical protein
MFVFRCLGRTTKIEQRKSNNENHAQFFQGKCGLPNI